MTREEAEKYAENMTYREAIYNLKKAKSVPYRKATFIKVSELLNELEQEPCKDAVSVASVFEIMGNLMSIPYDFDRSITEKDVSESMDKIRALPRVTPQEPFKPMVEIDLYSVIKQKYIEREVLDEIRSEIEEQVLESLSDGGDDWFTAEKVNECLDIIDKYKAESEVEDRNDK